MSGRRRVQQPDGRITIGYRKTLTTRTARPSTAEQPTLRVVFQLPAMLALVKPGLYMGGSITVGPMANVSIQQTTWHRDRLFTQAAEFLKHITPKGSATFSIAMVYTSSSEPGWRDKWRMTYIDGHVLVHKSPVEPIVVGA